MAKFLSITLCLAGVLVFALPAIRALSSDAAEDNVLNYAAFENPQRPIAVFDHDAHNEKAELEDKCWFCHHTTAPILPKVNPPRAHPARIATLSIRTTARLL